MARSIKNLLEHPEKDLIIDKLLADEDPKDINKYLDDKYSDLNKKYVLSTTFLREFKSDHLNIYQEVKEDLMKSNIGELVEVEDSLKSRKYKERLKLVNKELNLQDKMAELVAAIEMRAEQVFDKIQEDPRGFKGDHYLIQYFNLLIMACEKLDKINNGSIANSIVNNTTYNIQYIDQYANAFNDAIKETLAEIDLDASYQFMEKLNGKLAALKDRAPIDGKEYIPVSVRDSEMKLLDKQFKSLT